MKLFFYVSTLSFVLAIAACKKDSTTTYTCTSPCIVCEKASQPDVTLCRADYSSNDEYNAARIAYTSVGATCSTTSPSDTAKTTSNDERTSLESQGYNCIAE